MIPPSKGSVRQNDSSNVKGILLPGTWCRATRVSEESPGSVCKGMWTHAHGDREDRRTWMCGRKALVITEGHIPGFHVKPLSRFIILNLTATLR